MPYLLNTFYLFTLLAASPWLVYRWFKSGKYRRGWAHKLLGRVPRRNSNVPCAWFHAVSVGEVILLTEVVKRFRRDRPQCQCVVSTTTDTGFAEASRRFPDLCVFYWPLDFSWAVRQAFHRIRPNLVVLAEGEMWPNFLRLASKASIPVAVINGRMSPGSFRNYCRLSWLARPMLQSVKLFAMQTQEYADYLRRLGVSHERVCVTGSVKYDGIDSRRDNPRTLSLRQLFQVSENDLIWVAGSTQAPEEETVLEIYQSLRQTRPQLRLFLVPRQKERFTEVAGLLENRQVPFQKRSELSASNPCCQSVILVDTIGELGALWGLADIAFVGGSLDGRRGGQNMIEPAAFGVAVLFGPHVWNFADTANRLVEAGAAVQIRNAVELESQLQRLLNDPTARASLGTRARAVVESQQGAVEKTLAALDNLLDGGQQLKRAG